MRHKAFEFTLSRFEYELIQDIAVDIRVGTHEYTCIALDREGLAHLRDAYNDFYDNSFEISTDWYTYDDRPDSAGFKEKQKHRELLLLFFAEAHYEPEK